MQSTVPLSAECKECGEKLHVKPGSAFVRKLIPAIITIAVVAIGSAAFSCFDA